MTYLPVRCASCTNPFPLILQICYLCSADYLFNFRCRALRGAAHLLPYAATFITASLYTTAVFEMIPADGFLLAFFRRRHFHALINFTSLCAINGFVAEHSAFGIDFCALNFAGYNLLFFRRFCYTKGTDDLRSNFRRQSIPSARMLYSDKTSKTNESNP